VPPNVVRDNFRRGIAQALTRTYRHIVEREQRGEQPRGEIDVDTSRVIIFSDQHKGIGGGADDFRDCERAYNAALAFYFNSGYTLIELGDVEELWENISVRRIFERYKHSLSLSAEFERADRYLRFYGNHDDRWRNHDQVRTHLHRIYSPRLVVHEGMRFRVVQRRTELGHLFFVHGHQGTADSDVFAGPVRIPVRFLFGPIQTLTGFSLNTPAKDWELRQHHNVAMHGWATNATREQGTKIVLVTGHTHRPVFMAKTLVEKLEEQLEVARAALQRDPADPRLQAAVAELSADLEYARGQDRGEKGPEGLEPGKPPLPCYFNSGCCCYRDDDISGLEIAGGEIRLVRWPDDDGAARPKILDRRPLAEVFAAIPPP
jgi:hypothetical protein